VSDEELDYIQPEIAVIDPANDKQLQKQSEPAQQHLSDEYWVQQTLIEKLEGVSDSEKAGLLTFIWPAIQIMNLRYDEQWNERLDLTRTELPINDLVAASLVLHNMYYYGHSFDNVIANVDFVRLQTLRMYKYKVSRMLLEAEWQMRRKPYRRRITLGESPPRPLPADVAALSQNSGGYTPIQQARVIVARLAKVQRQDMALAQAARRPGGVIKIKQEVQLICTRMRVVWR
jgi:hypothetical protein